MKKTLPIAGVFGFVALLVFSQFLLAADGGEDPKPKVVESSMHEFMEYVFQPTYKRLRTSMKNEPADKAAWKAIKSDSLVLAESTNLLMLRSPEEKAELWNQIAAQTRSEGGKLYKAAGAKDFTKAGEHYRAMLTKCNACHTEFADGEYQLQP